MKKAKWFLISLLTLQLSVALAGSEKEKGPHHGPSGCEDIGLSNDQKNAIAEERFNLENKRIDLEAKLHHAQLTFDKLLTSSQASYKDTQSVAKELAAARAEISSLEDDFRAKVAFNILKSSQREKAQHCEMRHAPPPPEMAGFQDEKPRI